MVRLSIVGNKEFCEARGLMTKGVHTCPFCVTGCTNCKGGKITVVHYPNVLDFGRRQWAALLWNIDYPFSVEGRCDGRIFQRLILDFEGPKKIQDELSSILFLAMTAEEREEDLIWFESSPLSGRASE